MVVVKLLQIILIKTKNKLHPLIQINDYVPEIFKYGQTPRYIIKKIYIYII